MEEPILIASLLFKGLREDKSPKSFSEKRRNL